MAVLRALLCKSTRAVWIAARTVWSRAPNSSTSPNIAGGDPRSSKAIWKSKSGPSDWSRACLTSVILLRACKRAPVASVSSLGCSRRHPPELPPLTSKSLTPQGGIGHCIQIAGEIAGQNFIGLTQGPVQGLISQILPREGFQLVQGRFGSGPGSSLCYWSHGEFSWQLLGLHQDGH